MEQAALASKLKTRSKVYGMMLSGISWTGILPVLSKRNMDFVVIEMEHNHFDWRDLEGLLRTANMLGLNAVVRVADIAYPLLSKALDLGAGGILIPRIESFRQLEDVIDMMRLPPRGRKGVGGYDFAVDDLPGKLARYNEEKLLLIQVETPKVLPDLEQMLATGEIAGVIVGPYDMSMSLGIPGEFGHPLFRKTVEEVVRMCGEREISCGMYMEGEETIRYWRGKGMNIIWTGSDIGFLADGYNRMCSMVEGID